MDCGKEGWSDHSQADNVNRTAKSRRNQKEERQEAEAGVRARTTTADPGWTGWEERLCEGNPQSKFLIFSYICQS